MICSLIFTYGGSVVLVITALSASGASYQIGKICVLNPNAESTATTWGPGLAISVTSMLLQLFTIMYCVHIVLKPMAYEMLSVHYRERRTSADVRRLFTAQQASSRIRKLLLMQWRLIAIVLVVAAYTAFITSVFIRLGTHDDYSEDTIQRWFSCLASSYGGGLENNDDDDDTCAQYTSSIRTNPAEVLAALFMIGVSSSRPRLHVSIGHKLNPSWGG